jgi:curved DNA-binding protein CbpA
MDESASRAGGLPDQTHYDVLGVSPDASQDRVHRAYRSVLMEFRANPTSEMEDRVRRSRIAYQVLSDPESRALYNAGLKLPRPPQRRWERYYLQDEEESLKLWTGVATMAIYAFWGILWQYLILKGLLWLPRAAYRAIESLLVRKRPADEPPEQPLDSPGSQG